MKICILTQPLINNYGGILQAYALQQVLKRMGHEVLTENRIIDETSFLARVKRNNIIRRLCRKSIIIKNKRTLVCKVNETLTDFIQKNIELTVPIRSANIKELFKYDFDAYVVGSDQVWRPKYSVNLMNYFLDFARTKNVKRLAYAASFGTSEWEYTKEQTDQCKKLVEKFNSVSVREDSALLLCKKKLGVNATHVLDPTMLLSKEDYIKLIDENKENAISQKSLMVYVLDKTTDKNKIINMVACRKGLVINSVMPKKKYTDEIISNLEDFTFPSISDWLNSFYRSDFIVTDSFHGTVFSIIFNKPFITIANKGRGLTRFTSLLKLFNLEDRLIYSFDDLSLKLIDRPIDFKEVNRLLEILRAKSHTFLFKNLQI